MKRRVDRRTVDLSKYPDILVIYLGMRVNRLGGLKTVMSFGSKIRKAVAAQPEGLLLHENLLFSLFPPHVGMRQYWRDFESLERWTRLLPHQQWWQSFLRDPGGTGFWHEAYFMRGGMEAVYDDMTVPVGFMRFAPVQKARDAMYSARKRLHLGGESGTAAPVSEEKFYESGAGQADLRD